MDINEFENRISSFGAIKETRNGYRFVWNDENKEKSIIESECRNSLINAVYSALSDYKLIDKNK
jgi:hypothetical protein